MKREISKMQLCKSLAGLFCLFLTSGAPIEGMRLGNILHGKIQEQRKKLQALQIQIDEMNKNIEAEYQKNRMLQAQKKEKKQKDSDDASNFMPFKEIAVGKLKEKIPVLQKQVKEQKNLSDSIEKEIRSLNEEISDLTKELFMEKPSWKEYDQKCPEEILAFIIDTLADVMKTLGRTKMRYFDLTEAIKNVDDAGIMPLNPSDLIEEIDESKKQLNEKIAQCYNYRIVPINLMNKNDQEKASRSTSLSHENYELRRLLFMAENNITKEEFNSL